LPDERGGSGATHIEEEERRLALEGAPCSKLFDYSLLQPELSTREVLDSLETARRYDVASVVVRPCDIEVAVRTLAGASVAPGSVAGHPFGWQSTAVKLYEARDLVRRGARELGFVVALPKLLSREFQHVQTELLQAAEMCRNEGVTLKVVVPGEYLSHELKIVAGRCCERAEANFVLASTLDDARLFRDQIDDTVGVALSGVAGLDQALEAQSLGVARLASSAPAAMLDEWKSRQVSTTVSGGNVSE
jgi:deoxyribose-phosphate aldolase